MAELHDLDIGRHVKSSDGKDVGRVDRLVINPRNYQLQSFMIKEGHLFRHDVIAPVTTIDHIDDDGVVHLKLSADEAHQLNPYVKEEYYTTSPDDFHMAGGGRFESKGENPYYMAPPEGGAAPVPASVPNHLIHHSSISSDMVILTEGTDVFASSGEKIGVVDEVIYDEEDMATAFVVRAGHLFHHDVRIPIAWVNLMTGHEIHLSVTEEDCEKAKVPAD